MSITYMFVEKQRKDDLVQLEKLLQEERGQVIAKLNEFAATHPAAKGSVEDAVFELEHCVAFQSLDHYKDEHIIGVATASRFAWRDENGFSSIQDVEEFLKNHPGIVISNDYGTEITLPYFKEILQKYA